MNLPQTPLDLIAGQLDWAHTNINNNLDFIPDDKLEWKPAPTSKSALEIVNHATAVVNMFTNIVKGAEQTELTPAKNREEAKALISQVIQEHQNSIKALGPDDLQRVAALPIGGELPIGVIAGMPVVELINHHGQITYIETLLGDTESHLKLS